MDLGLGGATVVVSGGSKGMGRAAVESFAREGARVAILARGKGALDEAAARALDLGAAEAFGVPTDPGCRQSRDQDRCLPPGQPGEVGVDGRLVQLDR